MQIMVLGLGNILLSDEAVGVRVVEHLEERFRFPDNVELMDGGTAGMELLAPMAGKDLIVIVDAVRTGRAPGTPVTLHGDEVPAFFRTKLSPHQVGLSDVLATLQITGEYPKAVTVVGIEPVSLATGLALSGPVAARFAELVGNVLAELKAAGIEPVQRSVPGRGQLAEAGCFAE